MSDGFEFEIDKVFGSLNKTKGYKWFTRLPPDERSAEDHAQACQIIDNVHQAVIRRIEQTGAMNEFLQRCFDAYYGGQSSINKFNSDVWHQIEASRWLHQRDCENSQDDLWLWVMGLLFSAACEQRPNTKKDANDPFFDFRDDWENYL